VVVEPFGDQLEHILVAEVHRQDVTGAFEPDELLVRGAERAECALGTSDGDAIVFP
jgi:hypothetical protein